MPEDREFWDSSALRDELRHVAIASTRTREAVYRALVRRFDAELFAAACAQNTRTRGAPKTPPSYMLTCFALPFTRAAFCHAHSRLPHKIPFRPHHGSSRRISCASSRCHLRGGSTGRFGGD